MKEIKKKKYIALTGIGIMIIAALLQGCGSKNETKELRKTEVIRTEYPSNTNKNIKVEKKNRQRNREDKEGLTLFGVKDESFSIYFDENWISKGFDEDSWLCVGSKDGSEAVVVMQFPKEYSSFNIKNMDEVKELIIKNYMITDIEELSMPYLPELKNKEAYKGVAYSSEDGSVYDAYIVYGETDYALYCLMYTMYELDSEKIKDIGECFATFKEDK